MSYRPALAPLRVVELRQVSGTADLREIATTYDGQEFAIRDSDASPAAAASEWFGYKIAHCCQVTTPFYAVLELPGGRLVFGSRWEWSTCEFQHMPDPVQRMTVLAHCAPALSALLASDLFAGNEDRHLNNALLRLNKAGRWSVLALDWSRALFVRGFPWDAPLGRCNTTITIEALRKLGAWREDAARAATVDLRGISRAQMRQWLLDMPPGWLSDKTMIDLDAWWQGDDYHARLEHVLAQL